MPGDEAQRARRVDATSTAAVLLDVDGEAAGRLPIAWSSFPVRCASKA